MKFSELKTFLEIANLHSFSKAAMRLNYAHSSVSAQIKSLENSMGQVLFSRDNRHVTLTHAGETLYTYARQIIDLEHEARSAVQDTPPLSGKIIIAAVETISTYRLPAILKTLRIVAPDIDIEFKIMPDRDIHDAVRRGSIDFGFWVGTDLSLPNVDVLNLCREPVSIYAKPDHPKIGHRITPQDIAMDHHLLWASDCSYSQAFHRMMQHSGFHNYHYMEFANTETMKQCALSGLGLATLTDVTIMGELKRRELARLDFDFDETFYSFMFWNKDRVSGPIFQCFIQVVKDHFGRE